MPPLAMADFSPLPPPANDEASRRPGLSLKGEARRARIMDAAEAILAERGYYGCSLRDVAARAESNLGLLNYYFRSKEELFREIVDRRRDALYATIEQSLRACPRSEDTAAELEALIRAFVGPFLDICAHGDEGMRNYVRLTSNVMTSYRAPELQGWLARLQPVSHLLVDRLREVLPDLDDRSLYAGLYLLEASLVFMVQDPGFIDDLTAGNHLAARIDELTVYAAPFFAAGFRTLPPR